MANPTLAGFIYSSNGEGVNAITVNAYAAGDTVTVIATTQTDPTGAWNIANSSVQNPDIELVNGPEITRFKYADKIAITRADVQTLVVRNDTATSSFAATFSPTTLTAHRAITVPDLQGTMAVLTTQTLPAVTGEIIVLGSERFLTSSLAAASKFPITVSKSAAQSITSSTIVNDTHLQIALSSAALYSVTVAYPGITNGDSGRPVHGFSVPTGANLRGLWSFSANAADTGLTVTEASSAGLTTVATTRSAIFAGLCQTSATAGNIIALFRQNGADATATVFGIGSWMTVQRISS